MTLNINYSTKINERLTGQSISSEMHIIGIIATATYAPGLIRLVEVPQAPAPLSSVSIPGYTEIMSGTPTGTQFLVDYTTGVITFATSQDGNTVSVSYIGLGSEFAAEDVNEIQNPLGTIANQTIVYNWPSAPTVSWSLAPLNQALNANSHQINNVTNPTLAQDAATKNYVDTHPTNPAGSNTQIQYNNSGVFGASSTLTYDGTNLEVGPTGSSPFTFWTTVTSTAFNLNTGYPLVTNPGGQMTFDLNNADLVDYALELISNGGFEIFGKNGHGLSVDRDGIVVVYTNLGIGSDLTASGPGVSPLNASAILQVDSTTKGFLPPRMTSTQRTAISSPAAGLIVYDTTTNQWYGWNGSSWVIIG
jgi:hypothetical protein